MTTKPSQESGLDVIPTDLQQLVAQPSDTVELCYWPIVRLKPGKAVCQSRSKVALERVIVRSIPSWIGRDLIITDLEPFDWDLTRVLVDRRCTISACQENRWDFSQEIAPL